MSNILTHPFSFFSSIYAAAGAEVDLLYLQKITVSKSADHFRLISKIRAAKAKPVVDKLKKQLPAVTPSVLIDGMRDGKNIVSHSNLMCIDLDHVKDINMSREGLKNDPYTLALFISPSGEGLKLICKIDGAKHSEYFTSIRHYLNDKYKLRVDEKCSDKVRLMYLSHDPDFFLNPEAQLFPLSTLKQKPPSQDKYTSNTATKLISAIDEIETRQVDITSNHGDWVRIGFVCADLLGDSGREHFHRISQFYPKYSKTETDKQFDYCKKHNGSGVSIGTFFHIAKQHGLKFFRKEGNPGLTASRQNSADTVDENLIFWEVREVKGIMVIQILYTKLNDLLLFLGFRRYDIGLNKIFIRIIENVVEEVPVHKIQDALVDWIDKLPNEIPGGVSREELREKIFKNPAHYFNETRLTLLKRNEEFYFKRDTPETSFVYYLNGFVTVSADGIEFKEYSQLDSLIWKKQILQRNYYLPKAGEPEFTSDPMFGKFLFNLCGKDQDRYEGLLSIIGYLLHQYYDGKRKCLILTDSKISDLPEGRTGKTLLAKALGYIRCYSEVDGKSFDPENRFKWQDLELDTEIICLNDVKAKFNIDALFTAITETVKIEKKNKPPFYISAKLVITSNRTIVTEGASRKDRIIEFDVSDHYHIEYSPEDEFGCWFFKDWDQNEWQKFDTLMMGAILKYLQKGMTKPASVNLERRKLLEQVNSDFVEFMDEGIEAGVIPVNEELTKKKLHTSFLTEYPDYVNDPCLSKMRWFTKYLRIYSKYSPLIEEINPVRDERKSGAEYFITLRKQ